MIGVKLWGGLGNQMFQYAFGLYLAEKRGEKAFFFSDVNKDDKFDLNYFNVAIELIDLEELKKIGYDFRSFFLYRIKRKMIQLFPFINNKILVEQEVGYWGAISDKQILFDGYWQSLRYLLPIEKKIREQFALSKNIIPNMELYSEIRNVNSVSLHIRRGDYLKGKNAEIYANIPMEYYKKSINHFSKEIVAPIFYVFSNDLEWVKNNLQMSKEANFIFVDNTNSENAAIADFILMSSCKHHIIANSTFSWWAAWLNPSEKKIVIAPAKWYIGKRNDATIDLIPPEWERL
jgi:hypothetical protein